MIISNEKRFCHTATNFRSICSSFLTSVDVIGFHTVQAYSNLGLTRFKNNNTIMQ